MNRWARVQRQKASPTADLTKSPGGMFHHSGPIRCGALTRAATAAMRIKKMERQTIPATLIRGEIAEGGVTIASGAHQCYAHTGDHGLTTTAIRRVTGESPSHRRQTDSVRKLTRTLQQKGVWVKGAATLPYRDGSIAASVWPEHNTLLGA
jgi:hypothetical protein